MQLHYQLSLENVMFGLRIAFKVTNMHENIPKPSTWWMLRVKGISMYAISRVWSSCLCPHLFKLAPCSIPF